MKAGLPRSPKALRNEAAQLRQRADASHLKHGERQALIREAERLESRATLIEPEKPDKPVPPPPVHPVDRERPPPPFKKSAVKQRSAADRKKGKAGPSPLPPIPDVLSALGTRMLEIGCHCGRKRALPANQLAARLPSEATFQTALQRLVCEACQSRPSWLTVVGR